MQRTAKRRENACVPVPLSLFAQTSANFVFSTRKTAQGKCRQAGQPPLLFPARNGRGGGSPEGAEVQTCTLFSPLWAFFGTFLSQQKVTTSPPQRRREQRIKSRLVLKSNMGEMLRKAHQSHSKFPRNTAWQRVQRRLSQTQVNILSGFANAASSSASGYSKHNRS